MRVRMSHQPAPGAVGRTLRLADQNDRRHDQSPLSRFDQCLVQLPYGPLLRVPSPSPKLEGDAAFARRASEQSVELDVYGHPGDVQLVQVAPGPPMSKSPQA